MCVTHIGLYDHYASFVKEEENFNMCFAKYMQNLHTLYLSNSKQIKKQVLHVWYQWGFGIYGGIMGSFFQACILRSRHYNIAFKNKMIQKKFKYGL